MGGSMVVFMNSLYCKRNPNSFKQSKPSAHSSTPRACAPWVRLDFSPYKKPLHMIKSH